VYAEGQRRYVESLSAYARQFLQLMEKPDVDLIEGLSPAIAIEQKATSHNPRSTVGTVTEIHDYLRLLFARAGDPYCPEHDIVLRAQSVGQMVDHVLALPEDSRVMILSPVAVEQGEQLDLFDDLVHRVCASRVKKVDNPIAGWKNKTGGNRGGSSQSLCRQQATFGRIVRNSVTSRRWSRLGGGDGYGQGAYVLSQVCLPCMQLLATGVRATSIFV
jgi:hypothetical protein